MGTRADFYIGRGKNAQWLGSTAWDGYPDGIVLTGAKLEYGHEHSEFPEGQHLFDSVTEPEFKARLDQYFQNRSDVTLPEQGWPWPWKNSNTTDFAYAFDDGKVYGTCFGHGWWLASNGPPDDDDRVAKDIEWPELSTDNAAPAGSTRSGVMVITASS
jgi:hypothetical protein